MGFPNVFDALIVVRLRFEADRGTGYNPRPAADEVRREILTSGSGIGSLLLLILAQAAPAWTGSATYGVAGDRQNSKYPRRVPALAQSSRNGSAHGIPST